jgi:PAS domain S-box-containing protein
MPIYPLNRLVAKIAGQLPLRTVLIVPFVLQTVSAVGLVGYLSFKSGQSAVENLAHQLIEQVGERIADRLTAYLQTPQDIVAANRIAVEQGMLNLKDTQQLRQQLWQQTTLNPQLGSTVFFNESGEQIGYGHLLSQELVTQATRLTGEKLSIGTPYFNILKNTDRGKLKYYLVDPKGDSRKLIYQVSVDNLSTSWYREAKATGKQIWSRIFVYKVVPTLGFFAMAPVYDKAGKWRGIFTSNFTLSVISTFLKKLHFSKSGQIFIIDHSGNLVATSTLENLVMKSAKGQPTPLLAVNSQDTKTRDITRQLVHNFGNFGSRQTTQQLTLFSNHSKQFVRVTPYHDRYGLDLSIVVVVPESDFIAQIEANNRNTVLLCVGTLMVAIASGLLTARWITKPILRLNTAVKDIANGEWHKTVEIARFDEVGELAYSFNTMAVQLQESFAEQKSLNEALTQSENQLKQFLKAIPVGVAIHDLTGEVIYLNQASRQLLGIENLLAAETEQLAQAYQAYLAGTELLYPVENMPAIRSLKGEKMRVDDMEIRQPDRRVPLEIHSTPMLDEIGNIIGAIAVLFDITDRKQTEKILADYNRTLANQVAERTETLRESERRLSTLIANLPGYVYRVANDPEYTPEFISEGVFLITGYRQKEYLIDRTVSWGKVIHPADGDAVWELVQIAIATKQPYECEYRIITKSGIQKWVWERGRGIYAANGELLFLEGFVTDISHSKQIEYQLIKAQKIARIGSWEYEFVSDKTIWSEELYRIHEMDPSQEPMKSADELISHLHPDDRSIFLTRIHEKILAGQSGEADVRLIRKDGSICYLQMRGESILDEKGQLVSLFGTTMDISDRKQIEEKLQWSEKRLDTIVNNTSDGIMIVDQKGKISFANPAAAELFNQPVSELIGYYWGIPAQDTLEISLIDSHGKVRTAEMKSTPTQWQGELAYIVALRDITDRQRIEQEIRELSTALENAVEGISWLDKQGCYVTVNKAYASMTGYQPEEMIGMKWQRTVHPDECKKMIAAYEEMLEAGKIEVETRGKRKDGSIFYKQIVMIADYDILHNFIGHYCFMKDISDRKQAELALQQSQHRYQTLAEASPICIFRTDADGNCIYVNQRWSEITGLSLEEAINSGWSRNLHPEDRDRLLVEWYEAITLKVTFKSEYRFLRPDGKVSWVIGQALPEIGNDGDVIGYIGTITDISDRKLAEEALRESAQREKAIARAIERIHQSLDITTIFNTTTAELRQTLKCDRVVIYQFHPDWSGELVAESVANGWIPLMPEQLPELFSDSLRDSYASRNLPNNLVEDSDCTVKNLQHLPKLVRDTYIQETQGGPYNQGALYRMTEDIYKSGFTACYLKFLEQFQARAYLIVPIFCDNQLWGLLGSYQNSMPRTWYQAEINMALQIGTQLGVALQQAQLLEATQQQSLKLQQTALVAEAANRAKSTFIANMSHELRTPLNAILGFSELMYNSANLQPQQQENIRIINRSGKHLLALINQILDLAKIEVGRITINQTDFELSSLLKQVQEMFQLQARDKNLQLIFDCSSNLPQYVQTDEIKLRQILINLLSNAIKFTKQGVISVKVSRAVSPENLNESRVKNATKNQTQNYQQQTTIIFEIEDTGSGMDPDELDQLFQAFVQTKAGEASQQGSGLGLAISQQFVQLMGGCITVNSKVGCGTTFRFELPVTVVDASMMKPKQPLRQVIALEPNQPRYRILIVDDRSDNRQLLLKLLNRFEFELAEASNGIEAIEMWSNFEPHLIFMDLRMPVMDGYEATKRIKANTKGQATAIVAVSASNLEAAGTIILSTGCDDFIRKPFREAEILDALHNHLGVRYIYDEPKIVSESTQITALTPEALADLSADWVASLEQAVIECDLDLILIQIEQIRDRNDSLANVLLALANEFQFNQILALIQPEINRHES